MNRVFVAVHWFLMGVLATLAFQIAFSYARLYRQVRALFS